MVEHSVHTRSVVGSNPTAATKRPGGQAVKTPPFHGGNTSSILVRVTIHMHAGLPIAPPPTLGRVAQLVRALASHARGQRFESVRVHHIKTPIASESFAVWKRIGVFLFKEWISLAQRFYAGKV